MSAHGFAAARPGITRMMSTLALLATATGAASAQGPGVNNQRFEVTPDSARRHVGDPVGLRFRVRLDERDLLYDTVPRPLTDLPEGVHILAVEKLRRGTDRIYTGQAQVAFYRTGRQAVPLFGLPFMRAVKGVTRGILTSDSAFVEIEPLAPAGNPSLKDIKEIERQPGPDARVLAGLLGAAVVALVGGLLSRRRRAPPLAPAEGAVPPATALGPYASALARLSEIELERWPARGEVERHYEAVADVLRQYLEHAHAIPALERTTSELRWALPPVLAEAGLGERCAALLREADLVKFARRRPDEMAAAALLLAARDLLGAWNERARSRPAVENADALR
jgi:hypothetical protein